MGTASQRDSLRGTDETLEENGQEVEGEDDEGEGDDPEPKRPDVAADGGQVVFDLVGGAPPVGDVAPQCGQACASEDTCPWHSRHEAIMAWIIVRDLATPQG